ncbi:methyltransferase family protein [Aureisphaera galaxeae]|uniref:methyltransferase family protein n=1 Tax=Aureisphaera galaxeae TaxID=1538023 RepID=UPI002350EA08|nr:isoprenylcysteine carboxylmethyltransferase family protein [Aureisphaera galaxeae]
MKKDILFVITQFLLFAAYFGIEWPLFFAYWPSWVCYILIGVIALGIVILFFGILNLNENLTPFPSPKSNSTMISSGIYKYIRHPIYAGILLSMMAYAIYLISVFKLLVTAILWVVLYFKSSFEERLLNERFVDYKDYMKSTGRFFPKRRS